MPVELRVPAVGESITEVQIGDWLKQPGEDARLDEALVVIETDKVTVELPAPIAGRVVEVLKPKGTMAKVGEVIGYMETAGAAGAKATKAAASESPAVEQNAAATARPASTGHVMPAAARALATGGIDPRAVQPTGPGGRMLKEDVERDDAEQRGTLAVREVHHTLREPPSAALTNLPSLSLLHRNF